MTSQDYRCLERKFGQEFPFYEIEPFQVGGKSPFLKLLDNFAINIGSLDPRYKEMEDSAERCYTREGFRKIESSVDHIRFRNTKGNEDIVFELTTSPEKTFFLVYEYIPTPAEVYPLELPKQKSSQMTQQAQI